MQAEYTNHVVRFGVFEVDLRAGELRRQGLKVKLQDQPFQVLAMLLERPGQVVTREELRDRIWPAGIFVDFDKSLSKAINKIREALGDSTENSRFIETVPRRGYRFLVPVESGQAARPTTALPPPNRSPQRRLPWVFWGITAALAIAILVGGGLWLSVKQPAQQFGQTALMAVPLTTYPGSQSAPSFSPDGSRVAFAWDGPNKGHVDIYVKLIGTENLLRLTHDPAEDSYTPAWSPDGRYIAFLRSSPGEHAAVMLAPSIGGPPERKLTESAVDEDKVGGAIAGLSWSPDGKWIAVKDGSPGGALDSIYLFSMDTGEKRRLTYPPSRCGDGTPAFSPDGKRLAFSRTSTVGVSEVYVLDLTADFNAKGEPKQITSRHQWTSGLAWTPTGREIIFSSGSNYELWRVSVSRSGAPGPLVFAGEHGRLPATSTQGNRLAFSREYANDENIWRFDLSGSSTKAGKAVKLIASTRSEEAAQYSPDGTRIVFTSERSGRSEVWVCGSDGPGAVQLTSLGAAITGCPRWSPDGARIVFDANAGGNFDVYVINANGGRPKRLTDHPADDGVASWSRDGRSIYFVSNRTKAWEVWKMPADGGDAIQVTRNGGYVAFESMDGEFLYYGKRMHESTLWRRPVRGGEETQVLDSIEGFSFALLDKGIYFIRPPEAGGNCTLRFLSFKTGAVQIIASMPRAGNGGLSVSPDGRYALYTQEDQVPGRDLMLVENFR